MFLFSPFYRWEDLGYKEATFVGPQLVRTGQRLPQFPVLNYFMSTVFQADQAIDKTVFKS